MRKPSPLTVTPPANPSAVPASDAPDPAALAAVERAMSELRRGGMVVVRDRDGHAALVAAAESIGRSRWVPGTE